MIFTGIAILMPALVSILAIFLLNLAICSSIGTGTANTIVCDSSRNYIKNPSDNQCYPGSSGWKITGYYIPLENESASTSPQNYYVKGIRSDGTFNYMDSRGTRYYLNPFRSGFIDQVNIEGAGKTVEDKIIQSWGTDYIYPGGIKTKFYHYEKCAYVASGICITSSINSLNETWVMVAVTTPDMLTINGTDLQKGVVQFGTLLRILNAPDPWNTKTFWATDRGWWNDKHIDVFTGYGQKAADEANRLSRTDYSGVVIATGFKPIT